MGVHTWFYKKIQGPTENEATLIVKEYLRKEIDLAENLTEEEFDKNFTKNDYIETLTEDLVDLESNTMVEDLFRSYLLSILDISEYIPDRGYYSDPDDDLPYDLFRGGNRYGYLFSLESTLQFLEENKIVERMTPEYRSQWETVGYKRLLEFWQNYPDGIIAFG